MVPSRNHVELAEAALQWLPESGVIGLGTGRAANAFIERLGDLVAQGRSFVGVPTSAASADLARQRGIPLDSLDRVAEIDVNFDGADEVDPELNMIKGYGGALVRERVVASAARRNVYLVGEEKLVAELGSRGRLPIEVISFALAPCQRALEKMGLRSSIRGHENIVLSDNGNPIVDVEISPPLDPWELEAQLRTIPGVVGTGFFLGVADVVLVQREAGVETLLHPSAGTIDRSQD